MKRFYSQFRILLFTLALGLASVWTWTGFKIGNEHIAIDLPEVRSEDVIEVFGAERRWMPYGGGHHFVDVRMVDTHEGSAGKLTFLLIYQQTNLPYVNVRRTAGTNTVEIAPFLLECRKGSLNVVVDRSADNSEGFVAVTQDRDLTFQVSKPEFSGGVCQLYVGVSGKKEESEKMLLFGSDEIGDGEHFWKNVEYFCSLRFNNQ